MRIIAVGGTLRHGSSTERALMQVLRHAQILGASTELFSGEKINLPMYTPGSTDRCESAKRLIEALREADAIVLGSPGYHGGISGLVKNALDYTEDMSQDLSPYLDGRAVGCISTGAGWQGANSTLHALRSVAHSLRGWPTPLGLALNSRLPLFGETGECTDPAVHQSLQVMADQLVQFSSWRHYAEHRRSPFEDRQGPDCDI